MPNSPVMGVEMTDSDMEAIRDIFVRVQVGERWGGEQLIFEHF
jgi:hypothetical protein